MEFKPYTGLIRLQYRTIARRYAEWYEGWAAELSLHPDTLNDDLVDYLQMATRVITNGKNSPKWAVTGQEDEATAKKKYLAYLDAEIKDIKAWTKSINALDAPADPVLAPTPEIPEGDEKNG